MLGLEDPFLQEYEGVEDPFPQGTEEVEDLFPQGTEGPAQLSRGFISPAVSLFSLGYFSWGPAGGRRRWFAGAKAFGTADRTAVRELYDFAVAEAHVAGGKMQIGLWMSIMGQYIIMILGEQGRKLDDARIGSHDSYSEISERAFQARDDSESA